MFTSSRDTPGMYPTHEVECALSFPAKATIDHGSIYISVLYRIVKEGAKTNS
jgi:hypothetical protein